MKPDLDPWVADSLARAYAEAVRAEQVLRGQEDDVDQPEDRSDALACMAGVWNALLAMFVVSVLALTGIALGLSGMKIPGVGS